MVGPEIEINDFLNDENDTSDPKHDGESEKNRKTSKLKSIWEKALQIIGTPAFDFKGNGSDTINGGDDIDVIFGGDGNDTAQGGGGFADVLFGNDGNDTLTAHDTFFSLIIGGHGDDALEASTISGSLGSILIGDSLEFLGVPLNPASMFVYEFDGIFPVKLGIQAGLVQHGTGKDSLNGAKDGLNFLMGGDGNDTLRVMASSISMLGDSYNAGLNLLIDFTGVSLDKSLSENYHAIETAFELPGLAGDGQDTIVANGTVSIAVGGNDNDTVHGGSGRSTCSATKVRIRSTATPGLTLWWRGRYRDIIDRRRRRECHPRRRLRGAGALAEYRIAQGRRNPRGRRAACEWQRQRRSDWRSWIRSAHWWTRQRQSDRRRRFQCRVW